MKIASHTMTALVRGMLLSLVFVAFFAAGFLIRDVPPVKMAMVLAQGSDPTSVPGQYPLLTEVQQHLNEDFLRDQPDQRHLEYSAIRGLITALNDKFTFFIEPPVAQSESNVLAGKYGGIGVQLKRNDKGDFVLYPFRDAPAAKAGVLDGDILLKINGKDLAPDVQADALDQMLRGEVKNDNGVAIHIRRTSTGEEKDFSIVFQEIDVPSVVWRTLEEDPTFGYIQIMRFTNRTPTELTTAIGELKGKGIKALVFDLRDNPGGLLQESIQVAGAFLKKGQVVVYERSRKDEHTDSVPDDGTLTDIPMVVLINKNTASAAELVAGALHDNKRATLIGQISYGKGTVQVIFSLADKSSIHVTIAEWLSPSRLPIDGKGVTPDVPMIPDANGRDVELGEAVLFLHTGKT